jgi:ABC-2 type transport system ATP-binding protein
VLENPVEVRKLTGYLPEREPLYPDMEVAEILRFVGKARGLAGSSLRERTDWVLEACALKPVYRKLISDLSRGYRQRVGLAQALIHDPKVLILDELTSGLDPLQTSEIRRLVKSLAGGNGGPGKCIIFSTHVMQEAEAVSDTIVIINHGRIVADGKPDDIMARAFPLESVTVTVEGKAGDVEEKLKSLPGVTGLELIREGEKFVGYRITSGSIRELWQELPVMIKSEGWLVRELMPSKASLEDAFLALTRTKAPAAKPEGVDEGSEDVQEGKEESGGGEPDSKNGEVES